MARTFHVLAGGSLIPKWCLSLIPGVSSLRYSFSLYAHIALREEGFLEYHGAREGALFLP